MKNEQLYRETVDIILDAYNEGKLRHNEACGCFIGNIVAKKCEVKPAVYNPLYAGALAVHNWSSDWYYEKIIKYRLGSNIGELPIITTEEEGNRQIEATGYTLKEVNRLEYAFESAVVLETSKCGVRGQIEGMKAALKVLADIHETRSEESLERLDKIHQEKYVVNKESEINKEDASVCMV